MACEGISYDNAVYDEVSEKPAVEEFTIDKNSCYATISVPPITNGKCSEGRSDSSTKKLLRLLLMLFLVVLVLMLGTICACVAFALEISNLKSKTPLINTEVTSEISFQQLNTFISSINSSFSESIQQLNAFISSVNSSLSASIQQLNAFISSVNSSLSASMQQLNTSLDGQYDNFQQLNSSISGLCEMVVLLLANGALVFLKDKFGKSALAMAKDQQVAKVLREEENISPGNLRITIHSSLITYDVCCSISIFCVLPHTNGSHFPQENYCEE